MIQNVVRKTACLMTSVFLKLCCFLSPVDLENRVKTYHSHQKSHVRPFRGQSPLEAQNERTCDQKRNPKTPKMSQNPSPQIIVFLTRIMVSFWCRKYPKTGPKMTPKSTHMAPLVAQWAAWGSHGTPKMSLGAQNNQHEPPNWQNGFQNGTQNAWTVDFL